MEEQQKKKDLIDPATAAAVGVFTAKAAAHGIIGWLAVQAFRWTIGWFWKKEPPKS